MREDHLLTWTRQDGRIEEYPDKAEGSNTRGRVPAFGDRPLGRTVISVRHAQLAWVN